MNRGDLKEVFEKISFIKRYKKLCESYNDFDNRMRGVHSLTYEKVLNNFNYDYKYFFKEQFYKITQKKGENTFILQLVLKDGIVESSINIKYDENYYQPFGRFDFIPKKMGYEFDRKKYNLPKYTNEIELKRILEDVFSIFEDLKYELEVKSDPLS